MNKQIKGTDAFRRDSTGAMAFVRKLPLPRYRALMAALWLACSQPALANPPEFDFLTFAAIENFHSDKQWCDENYPEFKSKNELIFKQSRYAEMTTEEFIQRHASDQLKHQMLAALPALREVRKADHTRMPARFLQRMCASFDVHLGLTGAQALKGPTDAAAAK